MKTAVVIGGGQTLGAYLCEGLAEDGFKVAVADLNGQNAAAVADNIATRFGPDISIGVQVDATNEESIQKAFAEVKERLGSVDVSGV